MSVTLKIIYIFLSTSLVVLLGSGIIENRSGAYQELTTKVFMKTFKCDNVVGAADWDRITKPEIIKFHERGFYKALADARVRHGDRCISQTADSACVYDVVSYVVSNQSKLMSLVKSECVNPFITSEVLQQLASFEKNTSKKTTVSFWEYFKSRFNINITGLRNIVAKVTSELPLVGVNYDRTIKVHYLRYDENGRSWGLHLFKSPWGDVTDYNKPIKPVSVKGNLATFEIDLRNFRGSPDVNFIVHNGYEKDMFGLDMHWSISDRSEIWIVENQSRIFENERLARAALGAGLPGFSIFYYKSDEDYNGWGLHIWNAENNRGFTDWFHPLPGVPDGKYLRFDIKPKLIGLTKKIGFVIHKQNEKSAKNDFFWSVKPGTRLLVVHGETKFTEQKIR